jgi:3-oxoacyl-[acyl-carrier-protein] synthase II
MSMRRRVAITGMGTVNPCGNDVRSTWAHICAGESGIRAITRFDTQRLPTRIAGEVKDFDCTHLIDEKERDKMDLYSRYAIVAAHESIVQSGIDPLRMSQAERDRFGVAIGSAIGGLNLILREAIGLQGGRKTSAYFYPSVLVNLATAYVSIRWGFRGPNMAPAVACATGALAIGDAFRCIRHGYADRMFAGGTESVINPLGVGGFAAMRAISSQNEPPEAASRPFDRARDGFVMSEGAAVVLLEEMGIARARGAPILGEVVGYGTTADAHHVTNPSPDGEGAARAIRAALEDADIAPEAVGYINAHATSTRLGDTMECRAIGSVFGSHAARLKISATKSTTGHLLGAAGALETIVAAEVASSGVVPPTINVDDLDLECELDVTPNVAGTCDVEYVLNNSFGFGGTNACLVLRRVVGTRM